MPDPAQPPAATNDDTLTLWPLPDQRHLYMIAAGIVLGVLLGPAVMGRVLPRQHDLLFNNAPVNPQLEQAHAQAKAMRNQPGAWMLPPEIDQEIRDYERLARRALDERIATLEAINVTPQAIEEERATSERRILEHRVARRQREMDHRLQQHLLHIGVLEKERDLHRYRHYMKLIGVQMALVLALIAFAIAEALLSPPKDPGRRLEVSPRLAHFVTIRYALLAGWLTLVLAQPVALRAVNPVFAGLLVLVVLIAGLVPLGKKADVGHY